MEKEERLTVKEAAKVLGRTPDTVYRWIQEGYIHHYFKVRDGYFIPKYEIDRILIKINIKP